MSDPTPTTDPGLVPQPTGKRPTSLRFSQLNAKSENPDFDPATMYPTNRWEREKWSKFKAIPERLTGKPVHEVWTELTLDERRKYLETRYRLEMDWWSFEKERLATIGDGRTNLGKSYDADDRAIARESVELIDRHLETMTAKLQRAETTAKQMQTQIENGTLNVITPESAAAGMARQGSLARSRAKRRQGMAKVSELLREKAEEHAEDIIRPYIEAMKLRPKAEWSPSGKMKFYLDQAMITDRWLDRIEGKPVMRNRQVDADDNDLALPENINVDVAAELVTQLLAGARPVELDVEDVEILEETG